MLRFSLPFLMMWMITQPAAHAWEGMFTGIVVPGPDYDYSEPRPSCRYSFYWGREKIRIIDTYSVPRDCTYKGLLKNGSYHYECEDGSEVQVAISWGRVNWVHFNSTPDLTAYCQ